VTGQQPRRFNAYNSNKPAPIGPDDSRHLVIITSACKDLQKNQLGTYRGYVCADTAADKPDNGHTWCRVKLAHSPSG